MKLASPQGRIVLPSGSAAASRAYALPAPVVKEVGKVAVLWMDAIEQLTAGRGKDRCGAGVGRCGEVWGRCRADVWRRASWKRFCIWNLCCAALQHTPNP